MTITETIIAEIRDWENNVGEEKNQAFYRLHGALDALKYLADRLYRDGVISLDDRESIWDEAYKKLDDVL